MTSKCQEAKCGHGGLHWQRQHLGAERRVFRVCVVSASLPKAAVAQSYEAKSVQSIRKKMACYSLDLRGPPKASAFEAWQPANVLWRSGLILRALT